MNGIGEFLSNCSINSITVTFDIINCWWQNTEEPRGECAMHSFDGVFQKKKSEGALGNKTEKMSL